MGFLAGRHIAAAVLLCAGTAASSWAQQGIYTCVDSKGHRITADRPIVECIDREQREMTPGGTVLRKIGPSLTAEERAAEEARAVKALEEKNRFAEEKKRDRALLARYPDRAAHDKERAQALGQVDEVIATANKHTIELQEQRRKLDAEVEFYKGDPKKVPVKLKRQIDENTQALDGQKRFVANQEAEKTRMNARYEEELARLKVLWAQLAPPPTASASAAPKR